MIELLPGFTAFGAALMPTVAAAPAVKLTLPMALTLLAVALTFAVCTLAPAVKVTVAIPSALVVAVVAGVIVPPVLLNVTTMPGNGWLRLSRTVALRLVLPVLTGMLLLPTARLTALTTALLVLTLIVSVPKAPVLATALTVSMPSAAPAV
jgi:hypothetical protein